LRGHLWLTAKGTGTATPPSNGRVMATPERDVPHEFYEAVGYRALGGRLVRLDMLERFAHEARKLAHQGPFAATPALGAMLGGTLADTGAILEALGYRATAGEAGTTFAPSHRMRRQHHKRERARERPTDLHSPFAALRRMQPAE